AYVTGGELDPSDPIAAGASGTRSWEGLCRFGVAHGTGQVVSVDGRSTLTFVYGHNVTPRDTTGASYTVRAPDGRNATVTNLPAWDQPRWGADMGAASAASVVHINNKDKTTSITTYTTRCVDFGVRRTFEHCRSSIEPPGGEILYGVKV